MLGMDGAFAGIFLVRWDISEILVCLGRGLAGAMADSKGDGTSCTSFLVIDTPHMRTIDAGNAPRAVSRPSTVSAANRHLFEFKCCPSVLKLFRLAWP